MKFEPSRSPARLAALLFAALGASAAAAQAQAEAHNYPTSERVIYVQSCMREHPGPDFEMVSKCSCTLDKLAQQVPLDQFVSMSTSTNANSIGGERGAYIRDVELLQKEIKRFRELQSKAKKSCFIMSEPVR